MPLASLLNQLANAAEAYIDQDPFDHSYLGRSYTPRERYPQINALHALAEQIGDRRIRFEMVDYYGRGEEIEEEPQLMQ